LKKTYLELLEIDAIIAKLFKKNPKLKDGKFGYGYERFFKLNLEKIMNEMEEKRQDIRTENALTDKSTGELLYTDLNNQQRNYRYDKAGMMKMNLEMRVLNKEYENKSYEVIPYFISEMPEILDEERELLVGCLIDGKNLKT